MMDGCHKMIRIQSMDRVQYECCENVLGDKCLRTRNEQVMFEQVRFGVLVRINRMSTETQNIIRSAIKTHALGHNTTEMHMSPTLGYATLLQCDCFSLSSLTPLLGGDSFTA